MALKLGELTAVLSANVEPFKRDLDKAKGAFERHKGKLKASALAAGAAIGAALGAGLASAMELDAAQAKMEAQLGDPALAAQLGEIAGEVYGRGFGESAAQAMSAVQAVQSSGLVPDGDAAKIEELTVAAQAYATAWDTDVASATQYASTLIGSGLAKDATHAMDLITAASRKVPVALREDVLEAGNEYGTFFNTLGFSGEQAFALLAGAAADGQYGIDKTGDALKELTIRATDMSAASSGAYEAMGLDAEEMAGKILAGGDSAKQGFDQIVSGLLGIKDPTEQANAAIALFGTPLEDLNVSEIPAFLEGLRGVGDGLGDVSGAAAGMGESLEQSASQKLESFKRKAQQALVDKLAEAIPYIEATFGWLSRNSGWVGPLATGLGVLAVVIGTIIGVMKVWAAVQTVLNLAMWTSPITWIVAGVLLLVGVIIYIATQTTWFQTAWEATWNAIKTAAAAVWGWLTTAFQAWWGLFSGSWKAVGRFFSNLWSSIWGGVKKAAGWIADKFSALVDFVGALPGKIADKARGMWDGIKDAFRSALNWLIGAWNNLSFSIPGLSVPGLGQVWGGATLSTPDIPMLATGGDIMRAGTALVGERGPELLHLPRGAQVQPLSGRNAPTAAGGGTLRITGELRARGRDLVLVLRDEVRLVSRGDVQAALGGG